MNTTEIKQSIELIKDFPTAKDKKYVCEKFGFTSKKSADILKGLYELLREERKSKTNFTEEDVKDYMAIDEKESIKLAKESIEFVNYLKNVFYQKILDKNLQNGIPYATKRNYMEYGMSSSDKYTICKYLEVKKYLESLNTVENNEETNKIEIIKNLLFKLCENFYNSYIENIKNYANINYEKAEAEIDSIKDKITDIKNEIKKLNYINQKYEYNAAKEIYNTLNKKLSKINYILSFEKEIYVQKEINAGKDKYNSNINELAKRINKNNLNIESLNVTDINDDPKFISMIIEDGNKKLYARSIIAAEFSEYMVPHLRFIIK